MGKNFDVLRAVFPRVFMVETQSMKNLMDDVTHDAQRADKQGLLAADEAHIRSTTTTERLVHNY